MIDYTGDQMKYLNLYLSNKGAQIQGVSTASAEFSTGQVLVVKGLLTLFCLDRQSPIDLER
jgi:GDP-D-mannose dehydratase